GIQQAWPLQRAWISCVSSGRSRRKAATVCGERNSSSPARRRKPQTSISSIRGNLPLPPAVARDRPELVQRPFRLPPPPSVAARPQHVEDLRLRPSVDEDDEAKPEPRLVVRVQARELLQHDRVVVRALLCRGPRREPAPRADRRMGVEHLLLLVVAEPPR